MIFTRTRPARFTSALVLASALAASVACSVDKDDVPKPKDEDAVVAPKALILGQYAEANGDIVANEDGQNELQRAFTFSLTESTALQVRKDQSNGNCGMPATATFFFTQGEDIVAAVTIDPAKTYEGIPVEKLEAPLPAGEYTLITSITMEQECKGMLYFYGFFVEKAT